MDFMERVSPIVDETINALASALPYPRSLPEFQRLFPDDPACAAYLEKARWESGFVCPRCDANGEPFRIASRPGVLTCRKCRSQTGLTVGTVMKRSRTPLSVWFWAAYLVASQTPGISAVQLQRQLGLSRYETAFQLLHKLRAGMVRPDRDRIGGRANEHVEVDETWVGGRTRGEGCVLHHKTLVAGAVEVLAAGARNWRKTRARDGRYAGANWACRRRRPKRRVASRLRRGRRGEGTLSIPSRTIGVAHPESREGAAAIIALIAECGDLDTLEESPPISYLVFANPQDLAGGKLHYGRSAAAFPGLSRRVHVSIQPFLSPVQRLPPAARHRKSSAKGLAQPNHGVHSVESGQI